MFMWLRDLFLLQCKFNLQEEKQKHGEEKTKENNNYGQKCR